MPGPRRGGSVDVIVESASKRCFASVVAWPGWCRSGRDEAEAVAALESYRDRYRPVARRAHLGLSAGSLAVVERVAGNATTDFGAPAIAGDVDERALTAAEAKRMAALLQACWKVFDDVVAGAPGSLRKGPRGGGRDRDAIVEHVLSAENAYAAKLGIREPKQQRGSRADIDTARDAIATAIAGARAGAPLRDGGWLPRYAARRIAWHVLDHAWEIEDKST